jgi:hypoxanthine phosphoribosyltransferase
MSKNGKSQPGNYKKNDFHRENSFLKAYFHLSGETGSSIFDKTPDPMKNINVLDKEFTISLPAEKIQSRVIELAHKIDRDYKEKKPVFLGILNGSFMFASDLFKQISIDAQITFLKLASYQGTTTTGSVKQLIGLNQSIKDQHVIILEDIVDTGETLDTIMQQLSGYQPASVKIVTLLFKPDAYTKDIPLDYVGFEIPNDFIIGYGLDYDGFGRNYEDIYTVVKS